MARKEYVMTGMDFLHSLLGYGVIGLLIEVFFTGVGSLLHKNWRATCQTYLWMMPIYGLAGIALEAIYHGLHHWPAVPLALVYTFVIYVTEFVSGLILKKLIGRCPWDYGLGNWTPWGLINFKYFPYWFALACCFNPISNFLQKALSLLASV